jgi:hypothetical protein
LDGIELRRSEIDLDGQVLRVFRRDGLDAGEQFGGFRAAVGRDDRGDGAISRLRGISRRARG